MKPICLFVLLLLGTQADSRAFAQKPPVAPLQAKVPTSASGIEFSLAPTPGGYVLGEPIIMVFRARNTSAGTVNIDMGFDRKGGLSFTITDPERRTAHDLQLPKRGGLSRMSVVSIPASQTYEQQFVLDEWASFSIPGQYDVAWQGRLVPTKAQPMGAEVGSMVNIVIHPRNEVYLKQLCRTLTDRVLRGKSAAERLDAAFALGYVRDPIAIPYIVEAYKGYASPYGRLALPGLRRIGTEEAVKALKELSGSDVVTEGMVLRGEYKVLLPMD